MKIHTIQLNIGDYLRDISTLRGVEVSAYTLLMITCWHADDHRVPDNNGTLAMIARVTPKVWLKIRSNVMGKFFLIESSEGRFWTLKEIQSRLSEWTLRAATNQTNALNGWETRKRVASSDTCEKGGNQYPLPITQNPKHPLKRDTEPVDNILSCLSKEGVALARSAATGWDIQYLAGVYDKGVHKRGGMPTNPDKAFARWCAAYTDGKKP